MGTDEGDGRHGTAGLTAAQPETRSGFFESSVCIVAASGTPQIDAASTRQLASMMLARLSQRLSRATLANEVHDDHLLVFGDIRSGVWPVEVRCRQRDDHGGDLWLAVQAPPGDGDLIWAGMATDIGTAIHVITSARAAAPNEIYAYWLLTSIAQPINTSGCGATGELSPRTVGDGREWHLRVRAEGGFTGSVTVAPIGEVWTAVLHDGRSVGPAQDAKTCAKEILRVVSEQAGSTP